MRRPGPRDAAQPSPNERRPRGRAGRGVVARGHPPITRMARAHTQGGYLFTALIHTPASYTDWAPITGAEARWLDHDTPPPGQHTSIDVKASACKEYK